MICRPLPCKGVQGESFYKKHVSLEDEKKPRLRGAAIKGKEFHLAGSQHVCKAGTILTKYPPKVRKFEGKKE